MERITAHHASMALWPSRPDCPFVIEVVGGDRLPAHDGALCCMPGSHSDPYCILELFDANGQGKGCMRRSASKLLTVEPSWRFFVDFGLSEAETSPTDCIHIDIFDQDLIDVGQGDDHIGSLRVPLDRLSVDAKSFKVDTRTHDPKVLTSSLNAHEMGPSVALRRVVVEQPLPQRMIIFFVRHGESLWNEAQSRCDCHGMARQVDHELNADGIRQCERLRQRWNEADAKLSTVSG